MTPPVVARLRSRGTAARRTRCSVSGSCSIRKRRKVTAGRQSSPASVPVTTRNCWPHWAFRPRRSTSPPTAIDQVRTAHPDSLVDYRVADLFEMPDDWRAVFDLVVESMTVQSMPRDVREAATAAIRSLVAPGGVLLVIGGVLPDGVDPAEGPP